MRSVEHATTPIIACALQRRRDGWRRCEGLEGFKGAKKQFRKPTKRLCLAASLLGWHDGWSPCEGLEGFEGAKKQFPKPTKRLCLAASLLGWHDGWRRREGVDGFEGAKKQFRKPTKRLCLAANLLGWHDGWRRREGLEGFEGAKKQFRKPLKKIVSGCELAGLANGWRRWPGIWLELLVFICRVVANGAIVAVATARLVAGKEHSKQRAAQLRGALSVLEGLAVDKCILGGDLNMHAGERLPAEAVWLDAWEETRRVWKGLRVPKSSFGNL